MPPAPAGHSRQAAIRSCGDYNLPHCRLSVVPYQIITDRPLIEAYSRGELDRQEIAARLGRDVTVADLILALRTAHLPMPRHPSSLSAENQDWLLRWLSQPPDHGDAA
jgi:hypothetical protein